MAGLNYFSIVTYQLASPVFDNTFTVPFQYLQQSHVYVYKNGVALTPGTNPGEYEWLSETQVRIYGQLLTDDKIVFRRFTRRDNRLAEYFDGSTLTEFDLNVVTTQLLYLIQELFDWQIAGGDGDPPPGGPGGPGGDPGGPGDNDGLIDQIIADLLNSQLFQNLTQLIELVDINAETIMAGILDTHSRWGEDRRYGGLIRELDTGLSAVDARVTNEISILTTAQDATITQLDALQVRFNAAEADLITFQQVYASDEIARTTRFEVAESRIGTAEARIGDAEGDVAQALSRIGTIETTYATEEYAESYVQQQLDARFVPATLDGYLNATSVINGIRATANAQGASVQSISSYLVGSGATFNPDGTINWPANPTGGVAASVAGLQTTVSGQATQLAAEFEFRQQMAASFSGGNTTPAAITAGIVTAYQTYADVGSATALRVNTLETNRQPIFFRNTPPDPTTEPGPASWALTGFPEGSMWYQRSASGNYTPFRYVKSGGVPSGLASYGPYFVTHYWVQYQDQSEIDARGALLQTVENTYVREDEVGARVTTQLQAVYGANWSTINQRLESWIRPPTDGVPGLMYSGWDVRINQSSPAGPVIAGIGLGMQQDLDNPEAGSTSSFIVMANQFGVVKPPSSGDLINGPLDLSQIAVPFVIDTATSTVGINGTLLVKGSLYAYDGVMGRMTITELDSAGKPVSALGPRLIMPSGRLGWNISSQLSPFTGDTQKFLIWGGEGQMTHNNTTFYVDTDGNAVFKGRISADNIEGSVSNAWPVNWEGSQSESWSGSGFGPYVEIAGSSVVVPAPIGVQGMKVLVFVTALFEENPSGANNTSSGMFRITIEPEAGTTQPATPAVTDAPGSGGGTWDDSTYASLPKSISVQTTIVEAPFRVSSRGDTVSLTGVYNGIIRQGVRIRFWFGGFDSTVTTVKFVKGFVQGIR